MLIRFTNAAIAHPNYVIIWSKPGRYRTRKTAPPPDPETDARVAAFFDRMGIKYRPPIS
jgi:hypothetical protein